MKEYFNFNGTAKRQEYWAVIVISIVAFAAGFIALEGSGGLGALIALVVFIAAFWAMLATTVRRLRDAGLNVWWILATLVPYVGSIATIAFGIIGSKENDNG
jgi:uncharacterized membrane protein YhaH (DUF805 family)